MAAKAGDFLITEEKQLFIITDVINDNTGTYYDIKSLKPEDTDLYGQGIKIPKTIKSIPENVFRYMGKVVSREKMSKSVRILYG